MLAVECCGLEGKRGPLVLISADHFWFSDLKTKNFCLNDTATKINQHISNCINC